MSLVPSLLQAIVGVDGEALVMHAGDKPYVVAPSGQIELASRGLTLDAVNGIVSQLLPPDALSSRSTSLAPSSRNWQRWPSFRARASRWSPPAAATTCGSKSAAARFPTTTRCPTTSSRRPRPPRRPAPHLRSSQTTWPSCSGPRTATPDIDDVGPLGHPGRSEDVRREAATATEDESRIDHRGSRRSRRRAVVRDASGRRPRRRLRTVCDARACCAGIPAPERRAGAAACAAHRRHGGRSSRRRRSQLASPSVAPAAWRRRSSCRRRRLSQWLPAVAPPVSRPPCPTADTRAGASARAAGSASRGPADRGRTARACAAGAVTAGADARAAADRGTAADRGATADRAAAGRHRRFQRAARRRRRPSCCRCRAARSAPMRRRRRFRSACPASIGCCGWPPRAARRRCISRRDARPSVRVDGEIQMLEGEPSHGPNDVESLLLTLMPERNHEALRSGVATEWISDVDGVGRVRCLSFRDHRGPGRRVPHDAGSRGVGRTARAVARGAVAGARARRPRARRRLASERQAHDDFGARRSHQPHAPRSRHHDRKRDQRRPRARDVVHQPARGARQLRRCGRRGARGAARRSGRAGASSRCARRRSSTWRSRPRRPASS